MVPQQQRRRRRRVALPRTAERRVVIGRGAGGFGFTIAGQRPCVVSAVAPGGPAERAGLRAGDALLAVDGASVARAPHASVARLVAAAPGAIALSVAPRDAPPTDTEDTEPDERLTPHHAARLECRAVVGYLGTIETPAAASTSAPNNVRSAVRKLRQERRPATPVLLSVLPNVLLLRRPNSQVLAEYDRDRIQYAGCGSDADRRFFGLVTSAEAGESLSSHIFAVEPRAADHAIHTAQAAEFHMACTRDPVAERCLEFPPSAEYVVGVIRGMYSLRAEECASPALQQISKLAVGGDSPGVGYFGRGNRAFRRRQGQGATSPHPSTHSEVTTTSSNSDSGIGAHHDCRNIADRILVVDFAPQPPPTSRFRQETPRRPIGLVGCSSFDAEASFLSNTTPVVDGFGGQGRPLNLDDVILPPARHVSPHTEEDNYNYNNVYGNFPSTSRSYKGVVYDQVYTENEGNYYELLPRDDLEIADALNSVEIHESRNECQSNESVEDMTVISGGTSKASMASMDSVSVYSSRSHEDGRSREVAPLSRKHLQASLDDMLVLGLRDRQTNHQQHDGTFLHPASVKCKVRKSTKPLNILTRTKHMLTGRDKKEERRRAMSASAGDVAGDAGGQSPLPATNSEPDLRDTQSEQSSPFRRWTTGSGSNSSYRLADHRSIYNKQMSEGSGLEASSSGSGSGVGQWASGGVARWSLGLDHLLADPVGRAAFADFLAREFAHENIIFWASCEDYNQLQDPVERASLAARIWDRHLADTAPEPVNVDAAARRATLARLHDDPLPQDLFHQAQRQIFHVMRMDSYQRFLRSGEHAECARADLRGLPPPRPYARAATPLPSSPRPRSATPPPQLAGGSAMSSVFGSAPSTPSKLKKSASNVSERERRRSGGNSLLPWKLRVPSRDRSAVNQPAASSDALAAGGAGAGQHPPAHPAGVAPRLPAAPGAAAAALPRTRPQLCRDTTGSQSITDVVKSGALCRVVLPDGATSVVGVEEGVPVRRLIERLLQRRNLGSYAYDVLYKDMPDGPGGVVDANAPSSILGGREVLVERRCVVRMEVSGRVVAVRCRPARRLRHVLRPVLARYAAAPPAPARQPQVLRDGLPLHPDTPMEDLDGARLHVVAEGEGGLVVRVQRSLLNEEDTESLCDLALRGLEETLHRQEEQAGNYPGVGRESGGPGAGGGCEQRPVGAAGGARPDGLAAPAGPAALPAPRHPLAVLLETPASGASIHGVAAAGGSSACPALHPAAPAGPVCAPQGRVRAALRPGPPLHTHPPSFLENLRESQRQMLEGKSEPGTPPAPAPSPARAPPPLPPKPPARAPTLV